MKIEQLIENLNKYPMDTEIISVNCLAINNGDLVNLASGKKGVFTDGIELQDWLASISDKYDWSRGRESPEEWDGDITYTLNKTVNGVKYEVHTTDGYYFDIYENDDCYEFEGPISILLEFLENPAETIEKIAEYDGI